MAAGVVVAAFGAVEQGADLLLAVVFEGSSFAGLGGKGAGVERKSACEVGEVAAGALEDGAGLCGGDPAGLGGCADGVDAVAAGAGSAAGVAAVVVLLSWAASRVRRSSPACRAAALSSAVMYGVSVSV